MDFLTDSNGLQFFGLIWNEVMKQAKDLNDRGEFATGIVHNNGIWKPSKGRFRFLAVTRSSPRPRDATSKSARPTRQPLYEAHVVFMRILQHIEKYKVLREKYKIRQSEERFKAFLVIDIRNAFTWMV